MLQPASQIYALLPIGLKIEEAITMPTLESVAKAKAGEIVGYFVNDIFDSFGKTQDSTKQIFIATFVQKYSKFTIGELRCFADMVIAGDIEVKYLTTADLFKAWKIYTYRKAAVIEKQEKAAKREQEYSGEDYMTPEQIEQRTKVLNRYWEQSKSIYDDFLKVMGRKYDAPIGTPNVEFEAYRKARLQHILKNEPHMLKAL